MRGEASVGTTSRVQLFCCPAPELFAIVAPEVVEVGSFHAPPPVRLEGELARGLGDDLRAGRLSSVSEARLRGLAAALGANVDGVLAALAAGAFRRATPAALVRRGGFGILWIELLAGCSLACVHCYAESGPARDEHLDLATTLALLEDARALGFRTVQLTGGDPLLCPFLLPVVDAAREHGLGVEIFTNGLLLRPPLLVALRERGARLAFSLYADQAADHDAITGVSGSFDGTVDAIRRARDVGVRLRVAVVAMRQNEHRILPTLGFAGELTDDLGSVGVDAVRRVGRGRLEPAVAIPKEAYQLASRGMDAEGGRHEESGRACVSAAGDVYPCIFMRWVSLGRVGRDGRLRDILTAPTVRPGWVFAPEAALAAAASERLTCRDCQRAARLLALYAAHEPSAPCAPDAAAT